MSEDPRTILMRFPQSVGLSMPEAGPKLRAKLTSRGPHAGVVITVLEAVEGQVFTAFREQGTVCCTDGWLASQPEILRAIEPLLISDDIDLVCVRPRGYESLSVEDVFLVELRVAGIRRPWKEMRAAAAGSSLRLEPVLHRGDDGVSLEEVEGLLGAYGVLGRRDGARRMAYWYDTADPTSPRHGALVHHQVESRVLSVGRGRMRGVNLMTEEQIASIRARAQQAPKVSKADQKRFKKDMDLKGSASGAPSKQSSFGWEKT